MAAAVTVPIPGARFRVDLRHSDAEMLETLGRRLEAAVIAEAPPCTVALRRLADAPPNAFAADLRRAIMAAAQARGYRAQEILSAAGHDARHLATVTDQAAMIFIPRRAGPSQHPDEWAEPAHVTAGAQVLYTRRAGDNHHPVVKSLGHQITSQIVLISTKQSSARCQKEQP